VIPVHVVVPAGIDDPARPSGGNAYDRRICAALAASGWVVRELRVPADRPAPDPTTLATLAAAVAAVPDGGVVLVDGLIASRAPAVLVPESARVRLVVLLHMPVGVIPDAAPGAADDERAVLACARAVVTTSAWTRDRLLDRYRLAPDRVHVASPGADVAGRSTGTAEGGRLLCVAAVVPLKGQDLLVEALTDVAGRPWSCTLAGSLDRDPEFVRRIRRQVTASGLDDRIRLAGPLLGDDLRREYLSADLLVLPSRFETYGMVVTEALAAGVPVLATAVGGVPEALGATGDGPPGLLLPPDDRPALAAALVGWLADAGLRERLRRAALRRRATLPRWADTTAAVAAVLAAVAGEPDVRSVRVPG
jgi:glycosyltransferase involved in cell wall biosynthesis